MLDRLLKGIYLNLVRIFSRRRPVAFTRILKRPKQILLHLPIGAGEPWFALPAINSIRNHYRDSELSILLPEERETLLRESIGDFILYGKLTPLSRHFLELRRILRGRSFDILLDLNSRMSLDSLILSLLSGAKVRAGYRRRRGFPFFNCQIPPVEGDEVERNLGFLRMIGVKAESKELEVSISGANRNASASYLNSKGYEGGETLVGVSLDPGDGKRNWGLEELCAMLKQMERQFRLKALIFHAPARERFDSVGHSLEKEPIFPNKLTLHQLAGVISHCDLFITRKADLFPIAYGLRVPTILVLTEREAKSFSPPERDFLKVIEAKREGVLPIEEICKLAPELIKL